MIVKVDRRSFARRGGERIGYTREVWISQKVEYGEGCKHTEGERKQKKQKTVDNNEAGISLDITLVMEPKFGSVPDQGWNTTTS